MVLVEVLNEPGECGFSVDQSIVQVKKEAA